VTVWEKQQELRTGGVAFTDHWFELPTNTLWAGHRAQGPVGAGTEPHDPGVGGMDKTSAVDHPWGGAHWRDGVAPGGADQPDDLSLAFQDNARLARVRLGQEQTGGVRIEAAGTCARLAAGHRFTLTRHFDADGDYVVAAVRQSATCPAAVSEDAPFTYANWFECHPIGLAFRPQRVTPRPAIHGTQTGVVVGADGAEIDPDKYGRVKVWFRWDPDGQRGLDTSCWVRVAQAWAGKRWGTQFVPRVGDEVVVVFENGDPDQPLVIGSVYNADNMPVFPLPANKTQTGIKTHSSPGGDTGTFNEIKFEDKKGEELVAIHAQKDMSTTAENNYSGTIGTNPKADPRKSGKSTTTIFGDVKTTITKGDHSFTVAAGKSDTFVKGPVTETYDDTQTTTVTNAIDISSKSSHIHLTSPTEIRLTVGGSTITVKPSSIVLNSEFIHFEATDTLSGKAPHVKFEGTADALVTSPAVTVHGDNTVDVNGSVVNVDGATHAVMTGGAGGQAVMCDGGQVAMSGKAITAKADGTHTIKGSLVKIN
jgi:type VI secretion system secreted protein VgrG